MFSKEGCCPKSIFSQRRKDLSPMRTNTHVTPLEHLHQLARQCSVHLCSPRNPSNSRKALCHCSQELDYFRFGKMVLSQNSAKKKPLLSGLLSEFHFLANLLLRTNPFLQLVLSSSYQQYAFSPASEKLLPSAPTS